MFGNSNGGTVMQNTLDGTFKIAVGSGRYQTEVAFNNGYGKGRTEIQMVPSAPRNATFLGTFIGQGVIFDENHRPAMQLNGKYAIYTEFKQKRFGSNFIVRI